MILQNRKWTLRSRPVGHVKPSDFEFKNESIDCNKIGDNQYIVKNEYLAMVPTYRNYLSPETDFYVAPDSAKVLSGYGCGKVIFSKNKAHPVGQTIMMADIGWQDYCTLSPNSLSFKTSDESLPMKVYMGEVSGHSFTAFFALKEMKVKPGDIVSLTGATGAVGSILGQLCKLAQANKVIGFTGGAEKCERIKNFGFTHAVDYRQDNIDSQLDSILQGREIDVHFELVSRKFLDIGLSRLSTGGRISIIGLTDEYNARHEAQKFEPYPLHNIKRIVWKRNWIKGFLLGDYWSQVPDAAIELSALYNRGELKAELDVHEGLENAVETFMLMFDTKNRRGNLVVKI